MTVFVLKLMLNITKKVVNRQNVIIIQTVTQNHTVTAIITTQRKNITVLLLQTPVRIRQLLNQEVKQQLRLKAIQILKVLQKKTIKKQLQKPKLIQSQKLQVIHQRKILLKNRFPLQKALAKRLEPFIFCNISSISLLL